MRYPNMNFPEISAMFDKGYQDVNKILHTYNERHKTLWGIIFIPFPLKQV